MQHTLWDDTEDLLHQWQAWQTAQGLSPRTISERLTTIRALMLTTGATPRTLDERHIVNYTGRENLTPNTRASYQGSIRAFTRWMRRTRVRADDPAEEAPRAKRPRATPRPLTASQIARILAAANRQRTRDYIALAVLAGLRVHEIAKVHANDVSREAGTLTVVGKGGALEVLPLHPDLATIAERMPDGYWFPGASGRAHVGRGAVQTAISGAIRRAGIVGTPHQLRHAYGTALLQTGVNIRAVQELMRHASLETTQRYTATRWDEKATAILALRLAS